MQGHDSSFYIAQNSLKRYTKGVAKKISQLLYKSILMQLEVWYLYFININGCLQYLNHIRILSIPLSLDFLLLLRRFTNTFAYTKAHLFQGFPKRYCFSKLVKAIWSYILKVNNEKKRFFFTNLRILQNKILK